MKKKKFIKTIVRLIIIFVVITGCITVNKLKTSSTGTKLFQKENNSITLNNETYKVLEVDGGDRSGNRESNVAVNIGYGDREYWGFTNEYGQLICVIADKITLQDDKTEPVNKAGRYYDDEANVLGTEQKDFDQGHVIADSLGGVSNAYNITPQNSTLNRHGNQAYMEKVIRDAGGCKDFVATITYPDQSTQTPSKYRYEYVVKGNKVIDEFDNVNPENLPKSDAGNSNTANNNETNSDAGNNNAANSDVANSDVANNSETNTTNDLQDLPTVDLDGNGQVTIAEAKAAGFQMPITATHWLYPYMHDGDKDGLVGE